MNGHAIACCLLAVFASKSAPQIVLETFESDTPGELPAAWYNRDGKQKPREHTDKNRARYQYAVEEEPGNRFLRYSGIEAKHLNLPLGHRKDIRLSETPVLTWKWRAWKLPPGADEFDDDRNDAALSVYVVFKFTGLFRMPRSIRYTWSSRHSPGKTGGTSGLKTIVLDGPSSPTGRWLTKSRDLVDDYRRLFGEEPPETPVALLILSDADNTRTGARGDYDDFALGR
jgi:hypothetical protein